MTKIISCISVFMFLSGSAFSQQVVFEKKIELISYGREKRTILSVPDEESGETAFFFTDQFHLKGVHLSADSTVRELPAPLPDKKYDIVLGAQKNGSEYSVYFSNKWHTDLAVITMNFEERIFSTHLLPLGLVEESYSCSFVHQNKLHFFTRLKKEHGFALFTFNGNRFIRRQFTFPENQKGEEITPKSFYDVMWPENTSFISQIKQERLIDGWARVNIYYVNNDLVLTFDHNKEKTTVITIDTASNQTSVKNYPHENPHCKFSSMYSDGNSCIHANKLFQIFGCQEGLSIRATDLDNGNVLFNRAFKYNDEIDFRNTPFMSPDRLKQEIKSTAFIRKIANGRPGLSAYSVADKIVLTVGGYLGVGGGGGYAPMMMGGGASGAPTMHFVPTGGSMSSPTSIVYIDVLLAKETLEHVQGEISPNINEKTDELMKTPSMKKSVAHHLFQNGSKHYLAYYLTDSNTFVVRQIGE